MDFDDLGPASISLFSSLSHLDVNTLAFRTPEALSTALQQIAPNLQSLTLGNAEVLRAWQPLLHLCTSLRQLGCFASPRELKSLQTPHQAPPSLAFLLICALIQPGPGRREECKKFMDVISSSVEKMGGLKALQLDLETLIKLCKKKGMTLRLRYSRQSVGRRLVAPKKGTKEVKWKKIWSQVPL
jgi:hypothetical protein